MDDDPATGRHIRLVGALAARDDWQAGDDCPVARTLQVLSTRSAFVLLREAFYGATRFEQFVDRTELSEPVTAARLRELTEHGLLTRVPYRDPGQRTRHEYHLTEQGRDALPLLVALFDWGDRWRFGHGAPVELTHAACGSPVHARLQCDAGHEVPSGEVDLRRRRGGSGRRTGRHPA